MILFGKINSFVIFDLMLELPPTIHPRISAFVQEEKEKLFELVEAYGAPLHIVFPEIIEGNVDRFREVFRGKAIDGIILYAMKANKSEALLEAVANQNVGMDASSLFELRRALAHGVLGQNIGISGPAKDPRFLLLAIQQNTTISVDSMDELRQVVKLSKRVWGDSKVRIMIRLNDVGAKGSRFGIPQADLSDVYELLRGEGEKIELHGFAFHLDGYSPHERACAIEKIIPEIQRARALGFPCNIVNIGGGFTVSYLDAGSWEKFQRDYEGDDAKSGFFNGKKFQGFYPYHSEHVNGDFLRNILESEILETRKSIAEVLKDEKIELWIEPGRSLLDQAGITLMRVKGVKQIASGENIVEVEGNINHLSEQWFNTEFLPDPIHIRKEEEVGETSFSASVGGNTCMEMDMVTWRKLGFKHVPKPGDILVYVNTAGYQMDTNETEFHLLLIPEKVAAYQVEGRWRWKRDSQFSLLDLNS